VSSDVGAEDVFRADVRELLREAGFSVDKWVYPDVAGYVYGFMSDVELDVLARGGSVFAAEIAAAVKRSDLVVIKRKAELYQRATGRRVDGVLAIVAYIHDKNPTMVEDMAKKMGIELIRYSNIDSIL